MKSTDEHYVSIPISFSIADDGSGDFLVSDGRLARALRFARDGSPVVSYGRESSSSVVINAWTVGAWDSTVVLADIVGQRIHAFHSRSHELIESRPYLGAIGVALGQPRPEVWIGNHYRGASREHPSGSLVWTWNGDEVHIDLPDEWFRYPAIEIHSGLNVVKRSEDVLVAFAALEAILKVSMSGIVEDTLFLPVRRRRGVSRATLASNSLDTRGIVEHTSRMVLMDMDSSGNVLVVHQDARYLASGRLLVPDMWVSVIDGSLEHACVDGHLDVQSMQTPNPHFRGDTLWVQTSHDIDTERVHRLLTRAEEGTPAAASPILRLSLRRAVEPCLVADLAADFDVTERSLQRRCRRLGIAFPKDLLALARVFAVARLLHWSKRPLSAVALALGFSNDANCYRLLRRVLGNTLSRDMTSDDMDRVEEVILGGIVGPSRVAAGRSEQRSGSFR